MKGECNKVSKNGKQVTKVKTKTTELEALEK
jgi:hypothetical protein